MGFRGVMIAAGCLFSSIIAGYLAVYFLTPIAGEWLAGLGRRSSESVLASTAGGFNPTAVMPTDPNSWIGLLLLLGAVLLLTVFVRTLKAVSE